MEPLFLLLLSLSPPTAADEPHDKPPAEQVKAILKEFHEAAHANLKATTDEERKIAAARVAKLPLALLELVEKNPKDPIALEALVHVVTQEYWLDNYSSDPGWGKDSRQARAIALLLRDHLRSDKLGEACRRVHYGFRQECETFLRTVLEMSPHQEVRAAACLRLAQFLNSRLHRLDLLKEQPELAKRYESLFGKDYLDALRRQERAKALREVEALFEEAIDKYGAVKLPSGGTVATQAKTELFDLRHLAVGKEALDIDGADQDGKRFKLSDYRGKVVLLYFWSEY
jgi:hypothetical protein